ncbi:MAG: LysM peptidoglycan-binding domain-containing protein [Clostridia bacterium]|nr:LysM peptidoglycan-binding domain-containing protein [Clostridia bacterium]
MKRVVLAVLIAFVLMTVPLVTISSAATYTVQPGDTLYLIGKKFNINYTEIQKANNLQSSYLYPGQVLTIPTSSGQNSGYFNYTVQRGDTLFLIGKKFGVNYRDIMSFNGISNPTIYPGQVLKIPTARTTVGSGIVGSRGSFSWRDIELMARVVSGEARGEPFVGQVAVASVILNRLKNPLFPNTIAGVIYQPWAFTAVYDGQINVPPVKSAYEAVAAAIRGWDPTGGALYYWNPARATSPWVWTRKIITAIGNHIFAI